MKTTDKSRADALTDEQLLEIATRRVPPREVPRVPEIAFSRSQFIDVARAILAASPVEQHEAAPADDAVAQWQCRIKDRSSPVMDDWVNVKPDGAKTLLEKYAHVYEVRALYERAQPEQPAADERAAFERLKNWPKMAPREVFYAGWRAARASSLNAAGVEVKRHVNDDTPRDADCDAALRKLDAEVGQGVDEYWAWGFREGWKQARITLSRAPRTDVAGGVVMPPVKGVCIDGGYVIVTPAGGRDNAPAIKDAILALAGATHRQREELTDAQIIEIGYRHFKPGHNVKAEANFVAAVREVLATQQPEPRDEVTALIAAAGQVVEADRACALDDSDINALAAAIDAARSGDAHE
ncbi:hypothetical protein [Burkholderia cenocepacia]|uniref:hypothetical protein n=1 Tax=Burkholderia cenocepacia TaxID=95486 RepID=UPI001F309EBA|nr:hypothetical protein [Burkholderia cenocepacia]